MIKIRSLYDEEYDASEFFTVLEGESMTQQQFKDECDINNIIARYAQTGFYYDPMTDMSLLNREAMYGDFSELPDYRTSLDAVNHVREAFMGLSSEIRLRFENDPGKFLDFLSNPENRSEAIEMGLIVPEEKNVGFEGNDLGQNSPEKEPKP